ncbi:MAG: tRNA adenosine(34) deaminase TadA [Gammaproteobacteria bacterium]|jgi:tRNA(adenine34) deaminase
MNVDEHWMSLALQLAMQGQRAGEVPVGAVLIKDGCVLGQGWNRPLATHDPSAHAEIVALRAGGRRLRNYRLPGTILYVTLEPCVMCAGAIVQARVERVVFGAYDPKAGAAGSVFKVLVSDRLNHQPACLGGILALQASELMKLFFQARRDDKRHRFKTASNGSSA